MNFFERRALARVRGHLASMLEPDETILEFDIGRINGQRAEVIASSKVVYIKMAGTLSRTPYEKFGDIVDRGRFFGIRFQTQTSNLDFQAGRAPRPNLMQVLDERMASLVLHETTVDYPGGGSVRWRWRIRPDDSGKYFWLIVPHGVSDPDGETFRRWMSEMAPQLSERFGVSSSGS